MSDLGSPFEKMTLPGPQGDIEVLARVCQECLCTAWLFVVMPCPKNIDQKHFHPHLICLKCGAGYCNLTPNQN